MSPPSTSLLLSRILASRTVATLCGIQLYTTIGEGHGLEDDQRADPQVEKDIESGCKLPEEFYLQLLPGPTPGTQWTSGYIHEVYDESSFKIEGGYWRARSTAGTE